MHRAASPALPEGVARELAGAGAAGDGRAVPLGGRGPPVQVAAGCCGPEVLPFAGFKSEEWRRGRTLGARDRSPHPSGDRIRGAVATSPDVAGRWFKRQATKG